MNKSWIGFLAVIVIGVIGIIVGVTTGATYAWAFGGAFVIIGVVSWIGSATAEIRTEDHFEVVIRNLPIWVWIVDVLALVAAVIIVFVV